MNRSFARKSAKILRKKKRRGENVGAATPSPDQFEGKNASPSVDDFALIKQFLAPRIIARSTKDR